MIWALLLACASPTDRISPAALSAQLQSQPASVLMVDVRTSMEYQRGHIDGAVSLPFPGTASQADTLDPQDGQTVVLICLTGHRSRFPLDAVRAAHPQATVVDLEGGMRAWWAAGLPSTSGD